jgi:hypothetical protein
MARDFLLCGSGSCTRTGLGSSSLVVLVQLRIETLGSRPIHGIQLLVQILLGAGAIATAAATTIATAIPACTPTAALGVCQMERLSSVLTKRGAGEKEAYAATASSIVGVGLHLAARVVALQTLAAAVLLLLLTARTLSIGGGHLAATTAAVDFPKPGGKKE